MSPVVSVAPPGHELRVAWAPASGAQAAETTGGVLTVAPRAATLALGALGIAPVDNRRAWEVTVPGGHALRAVRLAGLRVSGGRELTSPEQLAAAGGLRLVVSIQVGGRWTPTWSVPPASARGLLPAQLTGATFSGRVLGLADARVPRLRLSLARGDTPESFTPEPMELDGAEGTAAVLTGGLELVGPEGAVTWSHPPPLPAPQAADLGVPAGLALNARLAAGSAPDVSFRLRGAAAMQADVTLTPVGGALVRTWPGVLSLDLAGEPAALPLTGPPLAAETPVSAVAGVVVRYAGRRLHDAVRDAVPAAGDASGPVVGETPVVRPLPPAALAAAILASAAPIGRTADGCELLAELVDLASGEPLGPPGVVTVAPSPALTAHPIELPAAEPVQRPAGVALRATNGRFLWAASPAGQPLLRLVVHDADPGGRPVLVGGHRLCSVGAPVETLSALPAAALRGPAAPLVSSDLLVTLELADLALRYAR
jgi:hypothetical protein